MATELPARRPVGVDVGFRDVVWIAFRLRAARAAVGAACAAPAAIARQVIGACTRVSGRIIGLPAILYDPLNDLLVGEGLGKGNRRKDEERKDDRSSCTAHARSLSS